MAKTMLKGILLGSGMFLIAYVVKEPGSQLLLSVFAGMLVGGYVFWSDLD